MTRRAALLISVLAIIGALLLSVVAFAEESEGTRSQGSGIATDLSCSLCVEAGDIAADAITESKLKAVDAAVDEDVLTYESTTGDFEWLTPNAGTDITADLEEEGVTCTGCVDTTDIANDTITLTDVDETSPFAFSALGATTSTVSFTSPIFSSNNADPADSGIVRLSNAESICWEASPVGTDVCMSVDSSERAVFTGVGTSLLVPSGVFFADTNTRMIGVAGSDIYIGDIDNAGKNIRFTTAGGDRWYIDTSGNLYPGSDNAYNIGSTSAGAKTAYIQTSIQDANSKTLVDNTATAFVRLTVSDDDYETAIINYTVYAEDAEGDERQVRAGEAKFAILNNSGTETCGTVVTEEAVNVTSGTLAVSFDCNSAVNNTIDLRVTANTSLDAAAETLTIQYRVDVTSGTATLTAQ